MVAADVNHPSVIMWGILNESHSHDPACRPGYERLLGPLRELDPTRPVTFASNHPFDDVCLDLADIISVNCYPGWYGGEIEEIPEELDASSPPLDQAQADKPLIISEIGAGAIYGWRDWNETAGSSSTRRGCWRPSSATSSWTATVRAGLAIWQFCDCRTSEAVRQSLAGRVASTTRASWTSIRRPKQAYETVKRAFAELR